MTAWDVSTKVYETSSSVGLGEINPTGMFFNPDGTKLYAIGDTQDKFLQYTCSTPWDVSTKVYETSSSVGLGETAPRPMFFKSDGTKLYVIGSGQDKFLQFDLSGSEPPAGENIYINIDDSYKQVAAAYVNVDDAWKEVTDIYVNVDDTWKAV